MLKSAVSRRRRRVAISLAVAAVIAVLGWRGVQAWQSRWYASLLPPSVEVQQALYIGSSGGFREGCGVAVYALRDAAQGETRAHELQGPAGAAKSSLHYGNWQPTPCVETDAESLRDAWLMGMAPGCAELPADMQARISAALATPGAFYATAHESGVLVIPSLGWVVFAHFG